jgi:hypothetical protein
MEDISPKNENIKKEINAIPKNLYLTKKKIKKTGIKSGNTVCFIKASPLTAPTMLTAIITIKAKKNTLLKVRLNKLFTIFL